MIFLGTRARVVENIWFFEELGCVQFKRFLILKNSGTCKHTHVDSIPMKKGRAYLKISSKNVKVFYV